MANDMTSELSRRLRNANMAFPGQNLRLDLYRLLCYFKASKHIAEMSTGENTCQFTSLRQDFEQSEIIRILVSSAVSIRWAADGHVDKYRKYTDVLNEAQVGTLVPDLSKQESKQLCLREACNKIIHSEHTELVSTNTGISYQDFIAEPSVVLHSDFDASKGWKATIDIQAYVDVSAEVASMFSAN